MMGNPFLMCFAGAIRKSQNLLPLPFWHRLSCFWCDGWIAVCLDERCDLIGVAENQIQFVILRATVVLPTVMWALVVAVNCVLQIVYREAFRKPIGD